MTRQRGNWTQASEAYLDDVLDVINGLRSYWPVTLRQVYYQLVAAQIIDNNLGQYQKLSKILSRARLDGKAPWKALEDRARRLMSSGGWEDKEEFIRDETDNFLVGYRRDLMQGQDEALEIWVEKDALSEVVHRVARRYCIDVVVARGYSSVSFVHEAYKRIMHRHRNNDGQCTRILYFGDMDPSGYNMLPAMMETLQDEMGAGDIVEAERCALTVAQINKYNLPHAPDALKTTDARAKAYVQQFGLLAVELDALAPAELEREVEKAIDSHLDMAEYARQQKEEETERDFLDDKKDRVIELLDGDDEDKDEDYDD